MKKLLGLVLFVSLLLVGCGGANASTTDDSITRIQDKGTLVVGINTPFPPYQFWDTRNNQQTLVGLDIDLAHAIAEQLGVEVVFEDIAFDGLIPSLASGQLDIVAAGITPTEARRQIVDFTQIYLPGTTVALKLASNTDDLNVFDNLAGKTVVVQAGTTQVQLADSIVGANIMSLPSVSDTVTAITTGQAQVLLISEVAARNIVGANPNLTYAPLEGFNPDLMSEGAAVAVPMGSNALLDLINELITQKMNDGTIGTWFTQNNDLWAQINQ